MRQYFCPYSSLCYLLGEWFLLLMSLGKTNFSYLESLVALNRKELSGNILEVNCL